MGFEASLSDNITELLVKIIKFTRLRIKVLRENIKDFANPGFVPKDLCVNEFSGLLNRALDEHICNRRLILQDTKYLRFGTKGAFQAEPVVDMYANDLLQEDKDKYMELQMNKIFENNLNLKIALELFKRKEGRDCVIDFHQGGISEKFYQ